MTRNADDRVAAALTMLRGRGHRRTVGRQAVLEALVNATHLSAAQVRDRLAAQGLRVDLSTVHRTLGVLVRAELVHVVPMRGRLSYGMADHPHHHAVCGSCGTTRQLPTELVAAVLRRVNTNDFSVGPDGRDGGVVVYGRCGGCQPGAAR
ncbi:transcriptional repressor [Solwaraspora sp. WMMD1047]|uniref:Fur family transcriptional regulator n=1 Tax=Solwaraspora sp. WMMD1047 TaxID=3016102 RepID=UPI002415A92C|nr:transcriptional repressor [Solwaraspora sp. WMMD1047]MDG4833959.1 transcriptional repressor [Solwaraspora sp. WMMD1047]